MVFVGYIPAEIIRRMNFWSKCHSKILSPQKRCHHKLVSRASHHSKLAHLLAGAQLLFGDCNWPAGHTADLDRIGRRTILSKWYSLLYFMPVTLLQMTSFSLHFDYLVCRLLTWHQAAFLPALVASSHNATSYKYAQRLPIPWYSHTQAVYCLPLR